ncbi:MAG TPA: hypothetical protein VEB21_10555, partial [Terriglobales bacterium]|nr:hypothetical protein [Terriglobales bacterium]
HLDRLPEIGAGQGEAAPLPISHLEIVGGQLHFNFRGQTLAVGPIAATLAVGARGGPMALQIELPELRTATSAIAIEGRDSELEAELRRTETGWHIEARLRLAQLSARAVDGERALDKLALRASAAGQWGGDEPLAIDLAISRGELLWGRYYADLGALEPSLRGAISPASAGAALRRLVLQAKGLGKAEGQLEIGTAGVDRVDMLLTVPELQPLFALAIAEPWRESYPQLERTTIGGAIRARLDYRRRKGGFRLTGHVTLADVDLASSEPSFALRQLNLDLPLALGSGIDGAAADGLLRFAGLTAGGLQVDGASVRLRSGDNRIAFAEPLEMPLLGGRLRLGELAVERLDSSEWHALLALELQQLDLGLTTTALGWPAIAGTLDGSLAPLRFDAGELSSGGALRAEVFGGRVELRHLRAEQLSSSVPTYGVDISFDDISLRQVTQSLELGRISGVARGGVTGLAIANGEPTRFDAWLETKPDAKEKQSISVRAIRQISILGGAGGDPISGTVMRLFDEYGYSAMGFRCRLENDKFVLHGVRSEGDKEYLVVGSLLPPRVDVVSHTQVISFSDMVERLRRIGAEPPAQEEGAQQ